MKEIKEMTNNTVTMAADMFVIPNRAATIEDFFQPEEMKKFAQAIKPDYSEDEKMVQVWLVEAGALEDENKCDNLCRHNFIVKDENGNEWYSHLKEEFIPQGLLEGKKEGDTISVSYPAIGTISKCMSKTGEKEYKYFNVLMEITLRQQGYRYARFGNFEEVLNKVL